MVWQRDISNQNYIFLSLQIICTLGTRKRRVLPYNIQYVLNGLQQTGVPLVPLFAGHGLSPRGPSASLTLYYPPTIPVRHPCSNIVNARSRCCS